MRIPKKPVFFTTPLPPKNADSGKGKASKEGVEMHLLRESRHKYRGTCAGPNHTISNIMDIE